MSKAARLVGFIVLWAGLVSSYAQRPAANRIDAIRTSQEVAELIHETDTTGYFVRVTVSDTLSIRNRACKCQARKKGVQPWVKADFDNNGYTDLLAVGDDNRQEVLLIMAFGGGKYRVQKLNYGSKYCFLPTLITKGSQPTLAAKSYQRQSYGGLGRSRQYRLVYKHGGFVEYNPRPSARRVKSIAMSYAMSYHETIKVDITITESGFVVRRDDKNGTVRKSVALLPRAEFDALADLINYARIDTRRPVYHRSGNHHPHYYLTMVYEDGHKQIDDDGGEGSMGLELLYGRVFSLCNGLHWQEMK